MPKGFFYAVRKGRTPGIYGTWKECEIQVKNFSKPEHRKFSTAAEADAYMRGDQPSSSTELSSKSPEDNKVGRKRSFRSVTDESQWLVVYSDGACKGNGKIGSIAGIGVFWGANDPRNLAERCPGDQTNNRAELIAIIRVLETTPVTREKLLIKTDSQYSINCFEQWLPNWRRNGFRTSNGEPVKNAGIIRYLSSLLEERGKRGQQIRFQYVRGHSGDPGNEGADAQANIGATLPPLPEKDWEAMESRASELVEALVPTKTLEPHERPSKMPKNARSVSQASPVSTSVPPLNKTPIKPRIPVPSIGPPPSRPTRSLLRPNTTANFSNGPTVYSRHVQQAASTPDSPAIPTIQPPSTGPSVSPRPQIPPSPMSNAARQAQSTPTPTTPRSDVPSSPRANETSKLPLSPKSPLTVSKVAPPLVPVSMNDVNLDLYKDCLLEGEEWEREIEGL